MEIARFIWRAWKYRLGSDRTEIEKMLSIVKRSQNCVDIGAHKGAYTFWLSKAVGLTGHVDAFEPQPQLAKLLQSLLAAADICNTEVHQIALSNKSGFTYLQIPLRIGGTPSASLENLKSGLDSHRIKVLTTTLDEFYDGHFARPISFIKCDAEGHELEIFQGGESTIREDRPVILFECEARHHSREKMLCTFDYLLSKNYYGFFFHNSELRPLRDFDPDFHQDENLRRSANNFLFMPAKISG